MKKTALLLVLACLALSAGCGSVSSGSRSLYDDAVQAWNQGQKEDAIGKLRLATEKSPRYFEAYIKMGEYQSDAGDYASASHSYEKAVELRPQHPDSLLAAGNAYLRMKEYLKAQHKYSQVLGLEKSQGIDLKQSHKFQANLGKGVCLLERTLVEEARSYLDKAAKMQPDSLDAFFYLGVLREAETGPNSYSMDVYQKTLEKEPRHLESLWHLGKAYRELDYRQKAVQYYQQYLEVGGDSQEIAEYVEKNRPAPAPAAEQQAAPAVEVEVVMACPECGRIGRRGNDRCLFDGTLLVPEAASEKSPK